RLTESRALYNEKQLEVTTGKVFLNRSEDPGTASEVAQVERQASDIMQFQENVRDSTNWVISSQAKIQEMVEILQSASEIVSDANNGSNPPEHRVNLASEIDSILEELLSASEAKFGETFLFSGTQTASAPFTETRDPATGRITAVTSNLAVGTEPRKSQINATTTTTVGELAGGTDGILEASGNSIDVFANLIAIRDELLLGNIPPEANMTQVDTALNHVIGKVTRNGVKQQLLEAQARSLGNTRTTQVKQLSSMQGADLAASLTELQQLQTTLQASMQMISQTNSMSLLNFI
ncbi:MAG: hypothetical protein HRT88_18025, partial [Lentisphaeraceae bacterium]|nr:hypothetical protein [Lentisphaeraceae bacterium]